jgi:hypothetical protein
MNKNIAFIGFNIPLFYNSIWNDDSDSFAIIDNLKYKDLEDIEEESFGEISGVVDMETGQILGWKETARDIKIFVKVRDEGIYTAYDKDMNVIGSYEGYVPLIFECDTCGWGDYFNMTIDKDGYIQNWENNWEEKMKNFLKYMEEYA